MIAVRNHAKERLEAGELALGVGLRQARTVDIGRIMKTAGYDFLFIDMEHNSMSTDLAAQISIAAQDAGHHAGGAGAGLPALPRHPGARCRRPGDRRAARRHARGRDEDGPLLHVPADRPSFGDRRLPQLDFRPAPLGEATAAINAATLLILMLETPEAIDNVEEIAAVPGSTSCWSAPTICAWRWASPASSIIRGSARRSSGSSRPAGRTASTPGSAACTTRR